MVIFCSVNDKSGNQVVDDGRHAPTQAVNYTQLVFGFNCRRLIASENVIARSDPAVCSKSFSSRCSTQQQSIGTEAAAVDHYFSSPTENISAPVIGR